MTALERARALRSRGLSVFPIPEGSKVPVVAWKAYQTRLASDTELVTWFGDGPSNIGIVTGAVSGVVVIDADTQVAMRYCLPRLPSSPWQTVTARGVHFYFAHPGRHVSNRGMDLETAEGPLPIHIRGDGGYVLAPGSVHPEGPTYRAVGNWEVPRSALPRFWPGWLPSLSRQRSQPPGGTPGKFTSGPRAEHQSGFLLERARRYLAAIPRPEIGHGSDAATLSAACRLVRGFALAPSDAEVLLWEWCGNRDGWTRDWVAEKVANAAHYGSEAMGGLR